MTLHLGMVTEQNMIKQEECADANPIRLNSRRLMCENTVYSVFFDHVSDAEGCEVSEYLSVLPKRILEDLVVGVSVLPVRDGKFGLIPVFRHPMGRWSWEAPKGFIDLDESPEQAAIRELYEETGFKLSNGNLCDLGLAAPEAGLLKGRIRLYTATLNTNCVSGFVADELGHGKLAFFDRSEISGLVASGQVEDACTLSLLFLYFIKVASFSNMKNEDVDA